MALYVTRPRRDEERIGRGLPSGVSSGAVTLCFNDLGLFRRGSNPSLLEIATCILKQSNLRCLKTFSKATTGNI